MPTTLRRVAALVAMPLVVACRGNGQDAEAPGRSTRPVGGLPPGEVGAVVQSHASKLRACFTAAAQRAPGLGGEVVVSWRIEDSGTVADVRVVRSSLPSPEAEACILREIGAMRFARTNAATHIEEYPLRFGG